MKKKVIDCDDCRKQHECCLTGAWVDLDEAKKILKLKIKKGDFFHLVKDRDYVSGYRTSTSAGNTPCTFLTRNGLCAIHKINYDLKPVHCIEFPYEGGRISPVARYLCRQARARHRKNKLRQKKES